MSSNLKNILVFALVILGLSVFWKPLLILFLIMVVGLGIFWFVSVGKSTKIREEIARDPEAYFERQRAKDPNIIDAEYQEKVVETVKDGGDEQ